MNLHKLNQFRTSSFFLNGKRWVWLAGLTGGAKLFAQGMGFLTGFLIIRFLTVEEFAMYTLANTVLGTMVVLADGGISKAVMAEGGKVWQDKKKLGAVLVTGLDLRKKFGLISLFIGLPLLALLLYSHNASWVMIVLISLCIIPAFFAALSDSLLELVPQLHQDIFRLQQNQVAVSAGRLILNFLFVLILPFTFVALLANGIPRILGNIKLQKISKSFADLSQVPDPVIKREILSVVKRILPGAVYFCFSGQITIWLLSWLGTTTSLAQIGALAKLILLIEIFGYISYTLLIPRFARLSLNKSLLLKKSFQVILFLTLGLAVLTFLISFFSETILWLLGPAYYDLNKELIISLIGGGLGLIAGNFFALGASRGWVLNPLYSTIISFSSVIIGVFLFEVSTLIGVLYFNIFLVTVQVVMNATYLFLRIQRIST